MGLWGKVTTADSRPKFLPVDSNAQVQENMQLPLLVDGD